MRQSCAVFFAWGNLSKINVVLYSVYIYIYIRLLNTLMWHWISRPTARFGCYSLSASGQKPCDIIVFHWETKRLTWKLFHTVSEARMKQESRTDGWMDGCLPSHAILICDPRHSATKTSPIQVIRLMPALRSAGKQRKRHFMRLDDSFLVVGWNLFILQYRLLLSCLIVWYCLIL